jgi:chromosome segregation ATPase
LLVLLNVQWTVSIQELGSLIELIGISSSEVRDLTAALLALETKIDQLIKDGNTNMADIKTDIATLTASVADVKQAAADEASRVDQIILNLSNDPANTAAVEAAIADLQSTSAALKTFHADAPPAPVGGAPTS